MDFAAMFSELILSNLGKGFDIAAFTARIRAPNHFVGMTCVVVSRQILDPTKGPFSTVLHIAMVSGLSTVLVYRTDLGRRQGCCGRLFAQGIEIGGLKVYYSPQWMGMLGAGD
jgi:hypothetical protein